MPERDANPPACRLLVIGYGNELRSDDAVGPRVAAAVEQLGLSGTRTIVSHQLTPELADPISQAERAVFVDATVEPANDVQVRELRPADSGEILGHASDPRTLLALARDVFGRCPKAWWLTIPVEQLDFGETLSPLAEQGVARAIEEIRRLAFEE